MEEIEQRIFALESRWLEEQPDQTFLFSANVGKNKLRSLRSLLHYVRPAKRCQAAAKDHIFSLTSATSPAHDCLLSQMEDKCGPYFDSPSTVTFIKRRRVDALRCDFGPPMLRKMKPRLLRRQ